MLDASTVGLFNSIWMCLSQENLIVLLAALKIPLEMAMTSIEG